jgi:hypothetical protein
MDCRGWKASGECFKGFRSKLQELGGLRTASWDAFFYAVELHLPSS